MAQAIDLRQQPAKAGSSRQMGWLALTAAAVLLAVGLAVGATQINIGQTPAAGFGADRSYDQVEAARGGAILSGSADHSYDAVEGIRGGAGAIIAPVGPTQVVFQHAAGRGALEYEQAPARIVTPPVFAPVGPMPLQDVPRTSPLSLGQDERVTTGGAAGGSTQVKSEHGTGRGPLE